MQVQTEYDHETIGSAIPIAIAKEAIERLEYASQERVCLMMLYYTGCRTSELDKMSPKNLYGEWIYWPLGKNQTGKWRKEKLPREYLAELADYRKLYPTMDNRLFGITGETFRTIFKHTIRFKLGPEWQRKRLKPTKNGFTEEYVLQLKGFRKTFLTVSFASELHKWGGNADFAMAQVSKRARHSTTKITVDHYIDDLERLGMQRGFPVGADELAVFASQKRLIDFLRT